MAYISRFKKTPKSKAELITESRLRQKYRKEQEQQQVQQQESSNGFLDWFGKYLSSPLKVTLAVANPIALLVGEATGLLDKAEEKIKNVPVVGEAYQTVGDAQANIMGGITGQVEGVVDLVASAAGLFGDDSFKKKVQDFVKTDYVGDYLYQNNAIQNAGSYINLMPQKGQDITRGVFQGIGQVLPSIATAGAASGLGAGAKAAQGIGTATFMAGAAGRGTQEAYQEGASYGKGLAYGTAVGVVEGLIERLTGGVATKAFGKGLINKVTNKVMKSTIGRMAMNAAGEGFEEALSEVINPYLKRMTYDPDAPLAEKEAILESAIIGALTSVAMSPTANYKGQIAQDSQTEIQNINKEAVKLWGEGILTPEKTADIQTRYNKAVQTFNKNSDQKLSEAQFTVNEAVSPNLQGRELAFKPTEQKPTPQQQEAKKLFADLSQGRRGLVFSDMADNINGAYKDGIVYVNTKTNAIQEVIKHELTHSIEGTKQYNKYAKYVIKTLSQSPDLARQLFGETMPEALKRTSDLYQKVMGGKDLSTQQQEVLTEVIAQYSEKLLTDKASIDRLVKEDRSLAQKIVDWIKDLIGRVKNDEAKKFLQKAEKLYVEALNEGIDKNSKMQYSLLEEVDKKIKNKEIESDNIFYDRQTGQLTGSAREQIRRFQESDEFENRTDGRRFAEICRAFKGSSKTAVGGETIEIVKPSFYAKGFERIVKETKELKLGIDFFLADKDKIEGFTLLDNPKIYIGVGAETQLADIAKHEQFHQFFNKHPNKNEVFRGVFSLLTDNDYNTILKSGLYGVYQDQSDMVLFEEVLTEIYSGNIEVENQAKILEILKEVEQNYKKNQGLKYSLADKKYTKKDAELVAENALQKDTKKYSIAEIDSKGRKLTKQQQEFFKDSKVRDEQGRLLVVYHGTTANEFTVFNKDYVGSRFLNDEVGFFFTNSESVAKDYTTSNWDRNNSKRGHLFETYLNFKKPLIVRASMDSDISGDAIVHYDLHNTELVEKAMEGGYDGIIVKSRQRDIADLYVAFEPEQIKLTTNLNPTTNEDIRYSLDKKYTQDDTISLAGAKESEKTEAKRLWKELGTDSPYFKKWFGNSKIVDDAGKPKIFYHGSKAVEQINSFDSNKSNYGGLIFFTSDPTFDLGWSKGGVADKFSWTDEGDLLYDGVNITDYEEKVTKTSRTRSKLYGGNVYPVYLKVEKPFDFFESEAQKQSLYDHLVAKGFSANEAEDITDHIEANHDFEPREIPEVVEWFKSNGYDGVWIREGDIDSDYQNIAVFSPSQIKSATGNVGTFNPKTTDIRYSLKDKRYTQKDAEQVAEKALEAIKIPQAFGIKDSKALKELIYKGLNQNQDQQSKVAFEVADYIIENTIVFGDEQEILKNYDINLKKLRSDIAREVLQGYDNTGKHSQGWTAVQKLRQRIDTLKSQMREAQDFYKAESKLKNTIDRVKGLEKFKGANEKLTEVVAGLIKTLSKERTVWGNLAKDMREPIRKYKEYYSALTFSTEADLKTDLAYKMIESIANGKGALTLNEMHQLNEVLNNFIHNVREYQKTVFAGKRQDIKELAKRGVSELEKTKPLAYQGILGKFNRYKNIISSPKARFERLAMYGFLGDTVIQQMWNEFENAQNKQASFEMSVALHFDEFLKANKQYVNDTRNTTVRLGSNEISKGQAIGLYLLSKREQAQSHLYNIDENTGTIRITNEKAKSGYQAVTQGKDITYTRADIESLSFTETDKKFIALAQEFFNKIARDAKYETDMENYFISNVSEGNDYIPMRVSSDEIYSRAGVEDTFASLFNVYNPSFNKEVKPNAKNKLVVENIFDTINRHASQMGVYYGYSTAIRSYNRIMNTEIDGTTMRKKIAEIDPDFETYVDTLLKDAQGMTKSREVFDKTLATIRGWSARAALGLNPKVVVTQLVSLFAARGSGISYKNILLGIKNATAQARNKSAWGTMYKYFPMAWKRAKSGYNTDIGLTKEGKGLLDKADTILDKTTALIEKTDSWVVFSTWNAALEQTKKDYTPYSEEHYKAAAKLAHDAVVRTQANYIPLYRSELLRSKSTFTQVVTMYMGEPFQQFSQAVAAVDRVLVAKWLAKNSTDPNVKARASSMMKESLNKAKGTYTMLAVNSILLVLITQAFKKLRGQDKEGEELAEDIANDFLGNITGMFPYIRDIHSYLQGYDITNMYYTGLTNIAQTLQDIPSFFTGDADEAAKNARKTLLGISQIFGVPLRNLENYSKAIVGLVSPSAKYKYESNFKKPYSKDLEKAIASGDDKLAQTIIDTMLADKGMSGADNTTLVMLQELTESGYNVLPKAISDTITHEDKEHTLTAGQKKQITSMRSKALNELNNLNRSSKFRSMTSEQKAKVINYIYDIYYQKALAEVLGITNKRYLFSEAIDITTLSMAMSYFATFEADTDKKGMVISGSKKAKIQAYVQKLDIPATQKYMLMGLAGYKNTKGESAVKSYINSLDLSKTEKEALLKASGY